MSRAGKTECASTSVSRHLELQSLEPRLLLDTHQLMSDDLLDVGNYWEYDETVWTHDGQSVDWEGTAKLQILRTDWSSGYGASVVQVRNYEGRSWLHWYLDGQNLVQARGEDEWGVETASGRDPTELLPMVIDETAQDMDVGHGTYYGWMKSRPWDTWTGSEATKVTFSDTETITVPAGTFDCVVVDMYLDWEDDYGAYGGQENTFWFNPDVGIVAADFYEWQWDPETGNDEEGYSWELVAWKQASEVGPATYPLFGQHFLDEGNYWSYGQTTTIQNGALVVHEGAADWTVTGTESVGGQQAAVLEQDFDDGHETAYWRLSQDYLLELRDDSDGMVEISVDPTELVPTQVNAADNHRSIGRGLYYGYSEIYDWGLWYGYTDTYVSFLRQESVEVPAGTFDAAVVRVEQEWLELDGSHGYDDVSVWVVPNVGVVKYDYYGWGWDADGWESSQAYVLELEDWDAPGGVTSITVERGHDYNTPGPGDEEYAYFVHVKGVDLTRLELSTPWGEEFDSADYLGAVWDGQYYEDVSGEPAFWAYGEDRVRGFFVAWQDVESGDWPALDLNGSEATVFYTGGSWTGQFGFAGVPLPAEVPQVTFPDHLQADVPLTPTFEWQAWDSPQPGAGIWFDLYDVPGGTSLYTEDNAPSDTTTWTVQEPLQMSTQYEWTVDFHNRSVTPVNGVPVQASSWTQETVDFWTLGPGVREVRVERGDDHEFPGAGDDALSYSVEVRGMDLARLELTTPWGADFDTATYLGTAWDGGYYHHADGDLDFLAWLDGSVQSLQVEWFDLSGEQWTGLDAAQADLLVTYSEGSWTGSAGFAGVPMPGQAPEVSAPDHMQAGVPLLPTIRWGQWISPGPDAGVSYRLEDASTGSELYATEYGPADQTEWTPPNSLDPDTEYRWAIGFHSRAASVVSDVTVRAESWAESDVEFTSTPALSEWRSGDMLVSIFDLAGPVDVDPATVLIYPSGPDALAAIVLTGSGPAEGLAITVSGATSVSGIYDARRGAAGDLAFVASDSRVGSVLLNSGISGYDLNGLTLGGIDFGADADGDGDTGDLTALYAGGDLGTLQLLGGDLNGDVVLTGSNVGTVMAIAMGGQGGNINGDIMTPNGNVSTVMAIGGGISGSIRAAAGKVGTVMAINGAITSPTIYGQTGVNLVQAITGGVASSITSGAGIGTVMAIGGDVDLTGGRSISAASTINSLMAINGDILGDGDGSPDIYVGNGNLSSLMAIGGGMQSVWVDVNGAGASAGRLSSVYVGGSVTNSYFEADGLLASLFAQGNFTNSSVQAGSLSVVYVGGTISEDSTDGDTDLIHANAGSYIAIDSTKFAQITPTAADVFGGVTASVA